MNNERENWNERYRSGSRASMEPDSLLVRAYDEFIQPLFPRGGSALDIAGGAGRHALWLAQREWRVSLVDVSDVGVANARKNAAAFKDRIDFRVEDLRTYKATKRYDLVVVFYYLERSVFPELIKCLRTGGLLIYKTYTREQQRFKAGPSHPMHLLNANELLRAFKNLRVLHYQETLRDRGVAEFVGRNL